MDWDLTADRLPVTVEPIPCQPAAVFAQVQAFIGLPPWDRPSYDSFNGMASGAMSDTTRALLTDRFRPHNQRLEQLLERPLGWDANPS